MSTIEHLFKFEKLWKLLATIRQTLIACRKIRYLATKISYLAVPPKAASQPT